MGEVGMDIWLQHLVFLLACAAVASSALAVFVTGADVAHLQGAKGQIIGDGDTGR